MCLLWRVTPTHSMCACWDHWLGLPEDLRSELLRSYGRDEFANYHQALLNAVETWRHAEFGGCQQNLTAEFLPIPN